MKKHRKPKNPPLAAPTGSSIRYVMKPILAPVEILIEVETTLPDGTRAIYKTSMTYNGDITTWSVAKVRASLKKTWRAMKTKKGDRLVAVHVPTGGLKRIDLIG